MAFKIIASQCTQCGACEFECPQAQSVSKLTDSWSILKYAPSAGLSLTRPNAEPFALCRTPAFLPEQPY